MVIIKKYIEFFTIEEAQEFGQKHYGDWLKDFQIDSGKYYIPYTSCIDSSLSYITQTEGEDRAQQLLKDKVIYIAFSYYCGYYATAINEFCRYGRQIEHDYQESELKHIINTISSEFTKFTLPENIIAYRTFDYKYLCYAQELNTILPLSIITDKGFTSLGLVKKSLLEEHPSYDTILKVYIPKGTPAIYLDLISGRPFEQELLLQKNTSFKIISNFKLPLCKRHIDAVVI